MTNLEELFTNAHGAIEVARKLGLHQLTVERWRKFGIPYKWFEGLAKHYKLTPEEFTVINRNVRARKNAKAK